MTPSVRVQEKPFDPGAAINAFLETVPRSGGVATFIGQVRDFKGREAASGERVHAMTLEHYPGMAERELSAIATNAARRWNLDGVLVIHRTGKLMPGEAIVLVATACPHRADAFSACEFLMDWLKTKAPFWKQEETASGTAWVAASADDDARAGRWIKP